MYSSEYSTVQYSAMPTVQGSTVHHSEVMCNTGGLVKQQYKRSVKIKAPWWLTIGRQGAGIYTAIVTVFCKFVLYYLLYSVYLHCNGDCKLYAVYLHCDCDWSNQAPYWRGKPLQYIPLIQVSRVTTGSKYGNILEIQDSPEFK